MTSASVREVFQRYDTDKTMENSPTELYAQLSYGEQLTYEELLDVEEKLIASLQDLLERAEAMHLDFVQQGDCLLLQCVFSSPKRYIFRKIAMHIAGILPDHVSGRLFFLDKMLESVHLYWVEPGSWREAIRKIPLLAPEDLPVHTVARVLPEPEEVPEDDADATDDSAAADEEEKRPSENVTAE